MYEIFEELLKRRGITAYKFCKDTGVNSSTISTWKKNNSKARPELAEIVCTYFDVSLDYLMNGEALSNKLPKGAFPVETSMFVKIPIIGSIRCGEPLFADCNIEDYEYTYIETLRGGGDFFYLRAKGDSMINAGISEGDLLLIRAQSDVDSGDIAIININGEEETLKRVIKKDKAIILQPENPAYETKIFIGKELEDIHIQGRLMNVLKKY